MNRTKLTMLGLAAALPLAGSALASAAGPNLIFHGDFTTNMNGWVKMGGQQHSVQNDRLKLVNDYTGNGNSYYGVRQCVDGIDDGAKYTITGDLWVDKGQSLHGSAGIYLNFNTGANCNGSNLGGGHVSDGHTEGRRGEWLELKHSVEAPDGAKSVLVRLVASKELAGSEPEDFVAYFDNIVMNEAKPIIILPTPTPKPDLPVANPTENPDPTPDLPVANPTETPDPTPDLPVANPTKNPDPTPDLPVANPTAESGGDADPGAGEESPAEEPVTQEQPQPGRTEQPSQGGETPGVGNGGSEDAPAPGAPQTGTGTAGASRVDPAIFGSVAAIFGGIGAVLAVLFRRSQQQPKR